jgi:hypothetical protein
MGPGHTVGISYGVSQTGHLTFADRTPNFTGHLTLPELNQPTNTLSLSRSLSLSLSLSLGHSLPLSFTLSHLPDPLNALISRLFYSY